MLSASVALAAFVPPAHLGAQDSTAAHRMPIAPGTRVRVRGRYLPLDAEPARVVEQRGDTLVLQPASGDLAFVPLDRVTELKVAQGRRSRSEGAWRGARVGAIALGVPTLLATSFAFI